MHFCLYFSLDNDYAFYTTTPDDFQINLIKVTFDADGLWGFSLNIVNSYDGPIEKRQI